MSHSQWGGGGGVEGFDSTAMWVTWPMSFEHLKSLKFRSTEETSQSLRTGPEILSRPVVTTTLLYRKKKKSQGQGVWKCRSKKRGLAYIHKLSLAITHTFQSPPTNTGNKDRIPADAQLTG